MSKKSRQYLGLLCALLSYYCIHEGAHLIYALMVGAFKKIQFMGLGIQIDIYVEKVSPEQLGYFCIIGSIATLIVSYILILLIKKIRKASSNVFKAIMYYITLALLFADPLYLSILYRFVGGGDMNGIALLIPEKVAACVYGCILLLNLLSFWKIVLPQYKTAFTENN